MSTVRNESCLPHSPEAERSVLGSMIRHNQVIGSVVQILRKEDFYAYHHQRIFAAVTDLYDQGKPVDTVILAEELTSRKQIEDVRYGFLGELYTAALSPGNAEYYARIVRDKAMLRRLIAAGQKIASDAADQVGPPEELLEEAEKELFDIGRSGLMGEIHTAESVVREVNHRIDERHRRRLAGDFVQGVPTGFVDLDNLTAGLQSSELIVVAARPSVGKTTLGLSITRNVGIEHGLPVFFASLEQSRVELFERLFCCCGPVDSQRMRRDMLSPQERARLKAAGGIISQGKIFVVDSPSQNMLRIASTARLLKMQHDIRLVVVDYLQLIEPDNPRNPRHEQVAAITRRLKLLARELGIPVLALAQLNRASEDRPGHEPRLADLRESGGIEQDADTVMLLNRLEESNTPASQEPEKNGASTNSQALVEVIVAKQRNGPTGRVILAYRREFMRFENFV